MQTAHEDAYARLRKYAALHNRELTKELGYGFDGIVFSTNIRTAIKSLKYRALYVNELSVYQRIEELRIESVCGFAVPKLMNHDNDLMVIEMQIVSPPFVLDFASAGLDQRVVEYLDEELAEWEEEKREQFEEKWPRVKSLLAAMRGYGIYLADVKPGNIVFEE